MLKIHFFRTSFKSYGHWLIKMEVDNPALTLEDHDYYWQDHEKDEEPETITLTHTTTNSRAVDGHDGYQQTLAAECIRANEWDGCEFDLSTLLDKED